ncbi:pyruvate dehydrogenase (acetyl-transferring) E1 component subunit alpha [Jiangella ureilytica]|uniref:Pyruvate dehydrogenase (Acetyl-transferring) E1 component subunit alpha n=1 Tax=Jiangella ureilytica TaxID=2530374 RepID=A0A4R4RP33_9ACTN|nr:pyruvate dehydrogenase (acetyl-transferring) E1 component subunit alpha [Jiangella ureilytica]TDC51480.1 pyruvate dehydrogenase (acetyl-transferring) E1 component subunit alpha [Jiangella ureilytica]
MTTQAEHRMPPATLPADADLLPSAEPIRFLDDDGGPAPGDAHGRYERPAPELLRRAYAAMVLGRRFDAQATALTKQGRLAVYPSSRGQEACQIGAVLALREADWLFPTYRDTMALAARGIDAADALTLLRGSWHCGYDPMATRTAPQCTPLATHAPHAVGVAYAARRRGEDTVALVLIGDGGTSEGDFHEALNFAAVFHAPVVFLVQNNGYAISVPLSRQTAAPSLAHKGAGYGVRGERVDGNDPLAVLAVLTEAVESARAGGGPVLVEAHTYRIEPHTNADDDARYRDHDEVETWKRRDPIARLEAYLRSQGELTDDDVSAAREAAEAYAADVRARLGEEPSGDPADLFAHVYAAPTPQLREQAGWLAEELAR